MGANAGANAMKSAGKSGAFLPALIFALFSFFFSVSCAAVYGQDEAPGSPAGAAVAHDGVGAPGSPAGAAVAHDGVGAPGSPAAAAIARDEAGPRQRIGSLTATGDVYVNDVALTSTSTVFAGDMLRTSGMGAATLVLDGKGSFRIFPHTEMTFAGQPQYVAELKLGKVAMDGRGATGINLRTGNSVVVPLAEDEESTSVIEAPSDGTFLVSCETGSVSVLPLQGGKGVFIEAGQSASISAQGELSVISSAAPPSATPSTEPAREPEPAARQNHGLRRWILIGAAAAGAGVAVAILTSKGSSSSPIASSSITSRPPASGPAPDPQPTPPSNPSPQPPSANPNPPEDGPNPPAGPAPPSPQPAPPSQPNPPGHDCDHHKKNCQPRVVIGFAFHF